MILLDDYIVEIYTLYELIKDSWYKYVSLGQLEQLGILNRMFGTDYTIVQFEEAINQAEWILYENYTNIERKEYYYGNRNTRQVS